MLNTRAMMLIPLMATIYSLPVIAVYHPELRTSHYIWAVGIICTCAADILWIWLSKSLDNNDAIAYTSLFCDVLYKLLVVIVPAAFFGVELSFMSYVGVSFLFVGGMLVKAGGMTSKA